MTFEEKEKWLNRAFELSKEWPYLKEEYDEVRRLHDRCTDISANTEPGLGSGGNSTENKYIQYVSASRSYGKSLQMQTEIFIATKGEISRAIRTLKNPAERAVLSGRFLRFKRLPEIAKKLHYSLSQVKRLKKQGIEKIIIKEDTQIVILSKKTIPNETE